MTRDTPMTGVIRRCLAVPLLAASLLVGCRSELSGTFEDAEGVTSIEFRDKSRVYVTISGMTVVGRYEVDGDRIIITGIGGSMVLTRDGDTLDGGPLGMTLARR